MLGTRKEHWRLRLSLAQKLACLAAGLGLLMTLAFTLLSAAQMRTETTRNYRDMLEAIMQVRENLLHQQYAHLQEWMDARERRDLAARGSGAALSPVLQRLLDENTGVLPLQAQLVFLSSTGEVLAPAALRQQSLPLEVLPALPVLLEEAAATRRIMEWSGPRGQYLYRVFYFAPQQWYVACLLPLDALNSTLARRTQLMVLTGLVLTLAGLGLASWLGRCVTAPLRSLDRAARILPELNLCANMGAPLYGLPPLPLSRGDEVGTLARSFDHMVRQLHENVQCMLTLRQEQARLQGELQLARAIQDGMLPHAFPRGDALDVHGLVLPAREVGGDFFDVFMLDEDTLCFAVGDVSDKGVPAALFMSMILCLTRTLLRQSARHVTREGDAPDPAAVLTSVNKALCRDNPRSMFATMILGVLDMRSGRMTFANAGHPPPLRLREGHGPSDPLLVEELPSPREMVAGAFEDVVYAASTAMLAPGDGVLLYTDGVTEALRADGQRFGPLQEHLDGLPRISSELNCFINEKIQLFVQEAPQADDITLLNFFWGPQYGAKNNIK